MVCKRAMQASHVHVKNGPAISIKFRHYHSTLSTQCKRHCHTLSTEWKRNANRTEMHRKRTETQRVFNGPNYSAKSHRKDEIFGSSLILINVLIIEWKQ